MGAESRKYKEKRKAIDSFRSSMYTLERPRALKFYWPELIEIFENKRRATMDFVVFERNWTVSWPLKLSQKAPFVSTQFPHLKGTERQSTLLLIAKWGNKLSVRSEVGVHGVCVIVDSWCWSRIFSQISYTP